MDKVVRCLGPKARVVDIDQPELRWGVILEQERNSPRDVVLAWYKTRADARKFAKRLNSLLNSIEK